MHYKHIDGSNTLSFIQTERKHTLYYFVEDVILRLKDLNYVKWFQINDVL